MDIHSFSVIIPVLHEASTINDTIQQVIDVAENHCVEIIVIDGDVQGNTIKAVTADRVIVNTSSRGRGNQLNAGASIATGMILLFLHADTLLPKGAFSLIASAMAPDSIVAGAFDLEIDSDRYAFRLIDRVASFRSRVTRIPYGDQAIFIRNNYFKEIGGFQNIPIMEDVELMQRIKRRQGVIHIIKQRVKTSPRRWEAEGIVRGTLRNWLLLTFYFLGVAPEKLSKFYQ